MSVSRSYDIPMQSCSLAQTDMSQFNPNEPFPWESTPAPGGARGHAGSHGSVADPVLAHPHRPFPDPATGTLLVDPDITLKAKGFDLEINLFYNSRSNANGAYGKKRSISTNAYVLKILSDFGNKAQLVRGDEKVYEFSEGSTSGGEIRNACGCKMLGGGGR